MFIQIIIHVDNMFNYGDFLNHRDEVNKLKKIPHIVYEDFQNFGFMIIIFI